MRALPIVVVVTVLAVAFIAFLFIFSFAPPEEPGGGQGIDKARLDVLEQNLRDAQARLEQLSAANQSAQNEIAMLGERVEILASQNNNPGRGVPSAREKVDAEPAGAKEKQSTGPQASDLDSLRQAIRDEIKLVEEEHQKQVKDAWKARQPEDWEKQEFGNLAWQVHSMGNKLDLTNNQKRQYYEILKQQQETVRNLWQEVIADFPNLKTQERQKVYRERYNEVLKTTRDILSRILTSEQQRKYEKIQKAIGWRNR